MLVIGIDVGLVKTGVAAVRDGRVEKVFTITVDGDVKDTGPRYAKLRESLSFAKVRLLGTLPPPAVVAIEQPDEDEGQDGVREGHEKMDVMKLYGDFAVLYAESCRLWREARVIGVTPWQWKGPYPKGLTQRILAARYPEALCANEHEWDGLGLASWAFQVAQSLAGKT